jgi:hypothetical protein
MPLFAIVATFNFVTFEADLFQQFGGFIRSAPLGCSARFSDQVKTALGPGADDIEQFRFSF